MFLSSVILRRIGIGAITCAALGFAALPGQAQMRQQMADQMATKAGNAFVSKIQGESCSDFAATMAKMKKPGRRDAEPDVRKTQGELASAHRLRQHRWRTAAQ